MKNTSIYQQTSTPVKGSLGDIAKQGKTSLAEAFVSCDAVAIVDVSGSMQTTDSGDKTRYERACKALKDIQKEFPGNIAVVAFSDEATFCPSGIPVNDGGSTNLAGALKFVKIADIPGIRFWVISDGMPDDPQTALSLGKQFKCSIDTVFIGPDDDREGGRQFLKNLAAAANGRSEDAFGAEGLGKTLKLLKG